MKIGFILFFSLFVQKLKKTINFDFESSLNSIVDTGSVIVVFGKIAAVICLSCRSYIFLNRKIKLKQSTGV